MRIPLLLLSAATAVFAQGPASTIQILAPSIRVIAGEQITLRAVVRDVNGVIRPNDIPAFSVDNVNLATIDQFNGVFTSKTLGVPRITARIGNINTSIVIQILPKRVVISRPTAPCSSATSSSSPPRRWIKMTGRCPTSSSAGSLRAATAVPPTLPP